MHALGKDVGKKWPNKHYNNPSTMFNLAGKTMITNADNILNMMMCKQAHNKESFRIVASKKPKNFT
jgi:hypothetical protein